MKRCSNMCSNCVWINYCRLRSKIWWFTGFCNSHYVSHFAAFFIVARTKISVVKSRNIWFYNIILVSRWRDVQIIKKKIVSNSLFVSGFCLVGFIYKVFCVISKLTILGQPQQIITIQSILLLISLSED